MVSMGGGSRTMAETVDFLILGAGIIGLNVALEVRRRYPKASIKILEKEASVGYHASGRNSGVLHAGFYYTANSLKARFSREGNQAMTEYCLERGLKIRRCGKLVVARRPEDLPGLEELYRRGEVNGVPLQRLSEAEAREIEPRARTVSRALFSPTTSTVSPLEVLQSLSQEARQKGIDIAFRQGYRGREQRRILTEAGSVEPGYLINAAGLYADVIARDFSFSQEYAILPFKGLYLKSDEPPGALGVHLYPVPDLNNPFLGVHYTLTVEGEIKIGPTAIPAFWREQYGLFSRFRWRELVDVVYRELGLLWHDSFDFRRLAWQEMAKYSKREMVRQARQLAEPASSAVRWHWGKPGIRAQLIHTPTLRLMMDFHHEGDERSFHLLNVVSPGFTCAIPFSRYILDQIESLVDR